MLKLITPPAEEPVTIEEARTHLRLTDNTEDVLLASLILAARQQAETFTGRAFITQTWELSLPEFGWEPIPLTLAPVQSITSVSYIDEAGAPQTLTGSFLDTASVPARLVPAINARWPRTQRGHPFPVTIRFVAGYGDADDVPQTVKQAILLMVADWHHRRAPSLRSEQLGQVYSFSYRDGEVAEPVTALLSSLRVMEVL